MKKRRSVKLNTCKSVLTVIVLASTLFHALPVSADVGVASTSTTVTVTYNKSESGIGAGNTYLGEESEYYDSSALDDDTYHFGIMWEKHHFYYQGKRQLIFTSNANFYGYAITVTRSSKTTLTYENSTKDYWVVGTATDLLNGQNVGGLVDASSFTVWVPTQNSVQAIHMAPFFLFSLFDSMEVNDMDYEYGSYNINCKYTVKYVGYKTKSDYETAMAEISTKLDNIDSSINNSTDTITDNMQAQTDSITSGFDSTTGNDANANLSANLDSYASASDDLFNTSSSGLNNFEFKNFTSYTAIVSSLSFINTLMASIFTAVGGESGPYGVVLSLLFSVVLVSLLIGLYRYYQNKK